MSLPDSNTPRPFQPGSIVRLRDALPLLPYRKSSIWSFVRANRFSQPVRLGARCMCWRGEDLNRWLASPDAWQAPQ